MLDVKVARFFSNTGAIPWIGRSCSGSLAWFSGIFR